MVQTHLRPPRLGSDRAPRATEPEPARFWDTTSFLLLVVLAVALVAARLMADSGNPLPVCLLRRLTGIPCPLCGTTRTLAALTRLDLPAAFAFNPLAFLSILGLVVWNAGRVGRAAAARARRASGLTAVGESSAGPRAGLALGPGESARVEPPGHAVAPQLSRRRSLPWIWIAASLAVLANWVYLWQTLPR